MKNQDIKNVVKNIARSKMVRLGALVIFVVMAVLSVPAFAFMSIHPSDWDAPTRGFGAAFAATLSALAVIGFSDK